MDQLAFRRASYGLHAVIVAGAPFAGVGPMLAGTMQSIETDGWQNGSCVVGMSTTRTSWLALCVVVALIMTAAGQVRALPWLALPGVAIAAWSIAPLIDRLRVERRVKVETTEGIRQMEAWLRTVPGVWTASVGAVVECCPICGSPVDPRDARCHRHGATT